MEAVRPAGIGTVGDSLEGEDAPAHLACYLPGYGFYNRGPRCSYDACTCVCILPALTFGVGLMSQGAQAADERGRPLKQFTAVDALAWRHRLSLRAAGNPYLLEERIVKASS